jgi:hypothetical protein
LPDHEDQNRYPSSEGIGEQALRAIAGFGWSILGARQGEVPVAGPSQGHGARKAERTDFRLANIAEAVRLAQAIPDGAGEVVIW